MRPSISVEPGLNKGIAEVENIPEVLNNDIDESDNCNMSSKETEIVDENSNDKKVPIREHPSYVKYFKMLKIVSYTYFTLFNLQSVIKQ